MMAQCGTCKGQLCVLCRAIVNRKVVSSSLTGAGLFSFLFFFIIAVATHVSIQMMIKRILLSLWYIQSKCYVKADRSNAEGQRNV